MKKYSNFLLENISSEFRVAIDIKNISDKELNVLNEIFKKHFDIYDIITSSGGMKPYALVLDIRTNYKIYVNAWSICTPGWGETEKFMINIIQPAEFLRAGLDGIVEYMTMRQDINKYNL